MLLSYKLFSVIKKDICKAYNGLTKFIFTPTNGLYSNKSCNKFDSFMSNLFYYK